MSNVQPLDQLRALRDHAGPRATTGLSDDVVAAFCDTDPALVRAIAEAHAAAEEIRATWPDALAQDERALGAWLQEAFVPFYGPDAINPYTPLAARGPWIVTSHGAVLHDSGGYGMLGFGHGPDDVIAAMAQPVVMANLMTSSFSQRRFADALRAEIGHTRGGCPFDQLVCLNSGSEANTFALRVSDIHAAQLVAPGARHAGKKVKLLAIAGGFHGRTDRPAQASDSSRSAYLKHLRTFRELDNLVVVPPNDVDALRAAFAQADADGVWFETMLVEPVMGEGNPGMAMTRAFYDEARRLTRDAGTLLLVDSIQAGLRAYGVLSFVDYPGFADAEPPDMEVYSKALNAAQFPLSVLALTGPTAALYTRGLYGNTMTTNPRALEVATTVLASITPALRQNVRDRGAELLDKLRGLVAELPGLCTHAQGTGLLLSLDIAPDVAPVTGFGGVEEACRLNGLGVIHGGANALRFTPHFRITSAEIDLMIAVLRDTLRGFAAGRETHAAK